jgi:DNA-binding beta-propeller fold protein YncE
LRLIASRPPHRRVKRRVAAVSGAALVLLIVAATALAVTGQLTQLPGTAGCISENGSFGCTDGKALRTPQRSVAVSVDGKSVYVAAPNTNAVAVFERNTTTGELAQLASNAGCVSESGSTSSGDACADGKALRGALSVAVSPDDKNVYVGSANSDAVAVFQRDTTTGALTQLSGTAGCVSQTGTGGGCADGKALDGVTSVAITADGKNVYAATSQSDSVAAFARDLATGELTQLAGAAGCIRQLGQGTSCRGGRALVNAESVAVTTDGKSVYTTSFPTDSVAVLRRDTATGALSQSPGPDGCVSHAESGAGCTDGKALNGADAVAPSTDGKHVYVTSVFSDAVAVFRRNSETGALVQLVGPAGKAGCVSKPGSAAACADGRALDGANDVAPSADGKSVYVTSSPSDAVAVFRRDATTGVLTQLAGSAGCVSDTGSEGCRDGRAIQDVNSVNVSPDGKSVYTTSFVSTVAVFKRETPP